MKTFQWSAIAFFVLFAMAFAPVVSVDQAVQSIKDAYIQNSSEPHTRHIRRTTKQNLEHLYDSDQMGRAALHALDMHMLSAADNKIAHDRIWDVIRAHDLANQSELKRLIPSAGWFSPKRFGRKAAWGAFLVVQHAENDPELQREVLKRIALMVRSGDISGENYALLYDRLAVNGGKPQRYGTQMVCSKGRWTPAPLEDADDVDALRARLGLKTSLKEYAQTFADAPPCLETP